MQLYCCSFFWILAPGSAASLLFSGPLGGHSAGMPACRPAAGRTEADLLAASLQSTSINFNPLPIHFASTSIHFQSTSIHFKPTPILLLSTSYPLLSASNPAPLTPADPLCSRHRAAQRKGDWAAAASCSWHTAAGPSRLSLAANGSLHLQRSQSNEVQEP